MKFPTLIILFGLLAFASATTIKSTFQLRRQCPYLLNKPHLDIAPSFTPEVKQVIASETCSLLGNGIGCRAFISEYPFDGVEFRRRRLADYEIMFLSVSLKLPGPLSEFQWLEFQSALMSATWMQQVSVRAQAVNGGSCLALTQVSYPMQSGACWSFDQAMNRSENEPFAQNEFCSIRLTHVNAKCALTLNEDGDAKARRVSMMSFDVLDCANKVAEDTECGSSFSWNQQTGVCICSTPGNLCNGAHPSDGGNVYIFRSGNFGYFGFEDEENEELKNAEEEEAANAAEQQESESQNAPTGLLQQQGSTGAEEETEGAETEEGEEGGGITGQEMGQGGWMYARGSSPYGYSGWQQATTQPGLLYWSANSYAVPNWQPVPGVYPAAGWQATQSPVMYSPSVYQQPVQTQAPGTYFVPGNDASIYSSQVVQSSTATPTVYSLPENDISDPQVIPSADRQYAAPNLQTTLAPPTVVMSTFQPGVYPRWLQNSHQIISGHKIGFEFALGCGLVSFLVSFACFSCYIARLRQKTTLTEPIL